MQAFPDVDAYVAASRQWPEVIEALRPVLRGCGLDESVKWGKPCYSHDGANICILQEMKDFLSVMFFKGALLDDPAGVLSDQGPNSRSARRMCFTSAAEVTAAVGVVEDYVARAVEVEDRGESVGPAPEPDEVDELRRRFEEDPALEAAFESLTPGRRREYHLYFSGAKQSATRAARVDKYVPRILAGKGLRDRTAR